VCACLCDGMAWHGMARHDELVHSIFRRSDTHVDDFSGVHNVVRVQGLLDEFHHVNRPRPVLVSEVLDFSVPHPVFPGAGPAGGEGPSNDAVVDGKDPGQVVVGFVVFRDREDAVKVPVTGMSKG